MVNSRLCETARPLFQNSRPRPKHFISSEPERKTWGGGGGDCHARFQVTGMIERIFWGLNFSISGVFLVGKVW